LVELTPKVAEIFPNWPNFAQIGAQKTNYGPNFGQLGQYSTKIRKSEKKLRAFDRF
jgi:hypothetical protein